MDEPAVQHCLGRKSPGGAVGLSGYLRLVPSEPFRLFFPAGLLVSVIAALLWPMSYAGWIAPHPAIAHSRLMIEGFVAAFAIGFMGTAGPRFLGTPTLRPWELSPLLLFYAGAVIAQLANFVTAGDVLFLGFLGLFALMMAVRIGCRTSTPPPGALLAGLGILCALAGAYLLATEARAGFSPFRFRLTRLLINEGFILLPIMGVGSFLFPRFLAGPDDGNESERASSRQSVALALACGIAVIASIFVDAAGWPRAGAIVRAAAASIYILLTVPRLFAGRGIGTMAWCIRVALISAVLGVVAAAFFPAQRVGLDHLLFVSGYGLLVFTVGGRVLFGHAGELARLAGRVRAMRWVLWLALFAATTRAVADFVPRIRVSHHVYAALLWLVIAVIWALFCLPRVCRAEEDDD